MTREGLTEAVRLADLALELEPRYGLVAALAAQCHLLNISLGYAVEPQSEREDAIRLIRLALSVGENDPDALHVASVVAAFLSSTMKGHSILPTEQSLSI
jgi:adenylate cyclase